jgi:rRNA maturation endonuclease Nob1
MATTLTEPVASTSELAYASFAIEKFEKTPEGDIYVLGKASDDSVDSDDQIVDSKWMQKAVQDWLSTGANVRVQHNSQRDPAGVGVEAYTENDGSTWVKSLVVEPVAKRLVEKGVLRAYSVGIARPKIMRDASARGGRIVDGELCEISLVDRPANKNCGIQLVKSAKDGTAEYVDELFGSETVMIDLKGSAVTTDEDIDRLVAKVQKAISGSLNKAASSETVSVELPKDVSVSFSPTDLAKLLKHRAIAEERVAAGEVAEKRKMDPDVGGGVDRDKIPAADFAGKNRSFPIVTPGDVSDAASSIGRAGDDNYSSEQLKSNIIRIAKRKGAAFVAELPEAWKKELGMNKAEDTIDVEKGKKKGKKAFPGAAKPFGAKDDDKKDDEAKPDTTKGMKDCAGCGKDYDADSKLRNCEGCGKKLPKANKSGTPDVEKKDKVMCQGCGAIVHDKHKFCPECGKSLGNAKPVKAEKNHDHACLDCSKILDKGEQFCPGCGKENPGYLPQADTKVKVFKKMKRKKGKPTPGGGAVGPAVDDIQPVPAHREPDGTAIEAFEHDAGLPTDPDSRYLKTADRFKTVGAPNDMGALHDHLCAAFHPSDVAKCFPVDALSELSVSDWQQKALDAAASAPLDEARRMTQMWQHAVTLKGTDSEVLSEIRDEVHKEFMDANKGPGTFPTPTELSPTRFRRPLLTDGHETPSPGHAGANTHSVPTNHISADGYDRGSLTAGHADDSPANKGTAVIEPAPLPPGMGRTYYRNAQRDGAKSAMAAMHDHIAQTFPDLCPMSGPGVGGEPAAGATPIPTPVGKSEDTVDPELTTKAQKLIEKARLAAKAAGMEDVFAEKSEETVPEVVEPVAPAFDPAILKSAIAEATGPLVEQLAEAQKLLKKQQKRLDALADLPDPREAPFKGLAMKNVANKSATGVPVAARTVAENAERTQMALMQALQQEARNNPDSAQREAAWSRLYQMTGLNP